MQLPRNLERWLPAYLSRTRHALPREGTTHLIIAVCDHFEPYHKTDHAGCLERLDHWLQRFPEAIAPFADSGGNRPRHTFFYPIEQRHPQVVEKLSLLCQRSGGEVEVHLHHKGDTGAALSDALGDGIEDFRSHGLLGSLPDGRAGFAFIHGNWAIANCHPQGDSCGVPDELARLKAAGCFADLTMPSAPHPTQFKRLNSIYYAATTATGQDAARGASATTAGSPTDPGATLLMIQGPLGLNWKRRKWGILPRVENADLTLANPPTPGRARLWMQLAPRVEGRPDWVFVKLHTHGALPKNTQLFTGPLMASFHRALRNEFADGGRFAYHYVSAREMVNLVHAAEAGATGSPEGHRDYRIAPPPATAP